MNINTNSNVKFDIKNTLERLNITYKQWVRLQGMTEDRLYKLLGGCLQLCYLAKSTDAHMSAFKEQCGFKWGRKTKLTVLVAKCVFGADTKQVHNYAKTLELAIEQKVGTAGETDMLTWLRINGGISGIVRGDDSKVSKRKNVIELERAHTIRVGRDAEKYGKTVAFRFTVSERFIEKLRADDVVMLCRVDRKNKELAVYAIDEDSNAIDKYYEELGTNVMESDAYAKFKHTHYEQQKAEQAIASFDVSSKLTDMFDALADDEWLEIAA